MFRLAVAFVLLVGPFAAQGARVDNFVLLDHRGDAHELYYHKAAPAIVVMVQANSCPTLGASVDEFQALRAQYETQGAKFFMLNSTLDDHREAIQQVAAEHGIAAPILDDESQLIGESLELNHSGETLVINPATWEIAYRGPSNVAGTAIDAVMNGAPVEVASSAMSGCEVAFPQKDLNHAEISYSETIAPLLKEKCVVCHTDGGLGPWAMTDYTMVQGFAPMIREVLRTKRMPPWHADPHIGVWKNDTSLSNEQLQTLVHWIEAGAPRGEGDDPLAQEKVAWVDWPLGEPDMVLDIPEYTIPANGVVDYKYPAITNPMDEGVWVRAATVVPGDRTVVHHILAGTIDEAAAVSDDQDGVFDNFLIGYAPGNESHTFPEGTGVYVPPGGQFTFQLHYTPVGKETVDRSKIGLYFHREKPENFYRQDVVLDPTIRIPPGEARHPEVAYYEFANDALLHDLVPHSHYRGVASKFELIKPDGSSETLLSVPNYDFNWQRTYQFLEPKQIPAGSRIVHTTWYDNSPANDGNPDPEREVPWGLQSWDEMLYGGFSYSLIDETTEAPIHDKDLAETTQFVGFLDKDMNGMVDEHELPPFLKRGIGDRFEALDANKNGGLDVGELHFLLQLRHFGAPSGNDAR